MNLFGLTFIRTFIVLKCLGLHGSLYQYKVHEITNMKDITFTTDTVWKLEKEYEILTDKFEVIDTGVVEHSKKYSVGDTLSLFNGGYKRIRVIYLDN